MSSEQNFDSSRKKERPVLAEAAIARAQRMDHHVAKRLQQRRLELQLSTKELADLINATEANIIQIENLEIGTPAALLISLASALKCKAGHFLEGFDDIMQ